MSSREAELLERVRGHADSDAMAQLYAIHRSSTHIWARRIAGAQLADDLVSQAFTNVFAALLGGRGPVDGLASYLRAAVRNAHIDHWRRTSRELSLPEFPDDVAWSDPTTSDAAVDKEALHRAIDHLPPRWKQVIAWTLVDGRPITWVAERLGLSPNAAAALAYRARRSLREDYLRLSAD